jgi:hypothetical protein
MQSRRDLLKHFGIGTVIVPLVGGAAEITAPAKLIEVPSIEAVKTLPRSLNLKDLKSVTVVFEHSDGSVSTFKSDYWVQGYGKNLKAGSKLSLSIVLHAGQSPLVDVGNVYSSGTLL